MRRKKPNDQLKKSWPGTQKPRYVDLACVSGLPGLVFFFLRTNYLFVFLKTIIDDKTYVTIQKVFAPRHANPQPLTKRYHTLQKNKIKRTQYFIVYTLIF